MEISRLFVILLSVGIVQSGCPSICICTEEAVQCVNKKIECIPGFESLRTQPAVIDLSGNEINIVDFDDFSFDASEFVVEIYLNSSNVIDIDGKAFKELVKLQQLYLHDNHLYEIPEDLVESNKDLVLLNLSKNQFETMPRIISDSLEILALADSKISTVPEDSLDFLPNIKLLLLQQNNIKEISIDMFKGAKNFFFTTLTYNAWHCNCKTIDLFDYLVSKNFVDRDEAVFCLSEEKNFVNIYENGVIEKYKDQCGLNTDRDVLFSVSLIKTDKEIVKGDLKQTSNLIAVDEEVPTIVNVPPVTDAKDIRICPSNSLSIVDLGFIFTVTSIIVLTSFFLGFYIGKRRNSYIMGSTDSNFKLILP